MKRYHVGRSSDKADIVIPDPNRTVSSIHGSISQDGLGRWYYEDQSRNGTYIYRADTWMKLDKGFINPGERLRLGAQEVEAGWLIREVQQRIRRENNLGPGRPKPKAVTPPTDALAKKEPLDQKAALGEKRQGEKRQGEKRLGEKKNEARTGRYVRNPETGEILWIEDSN